MGKKIKLKQKNKKREVLHCPSCGLIMGTRLRKVQQYDSKSSIVAQGYYFQYFCKKCDDEFTGWTTTASDELSVSLNRMLNQ